MTSPHATPRPNAGYTCHADGCAVQVPPRLLMCLKHWRMVPRRLQAAVWATYEAGQEVSKTPSAAYVAAARAAIAAVAEKERQAGLFSCCGTVTDIPSPVRRFP